MSHQLFLTDLGKQKLAELASVGTGQALTISDFVVGSGRDVDFSKRLDRQTLVSKKYQARVQDVVKTAPNQYEISCIIPADIGGFTIREIGLLASDNTLMWVGSLPEVQKPTQDSLSAVDYRVKCVVAIDNAEVVLTVDGNVVTATRQWVENKLNEALLTEIATLKEEITQLKLRPVPAIPVGGLLTTTKHYADGEAVANDLGYGKWERAILGRALVGFDPNASDWTGTMGKKYGKNEHTLTIDEMPRHSHEWLYGREGDDNNYGGSHDEFTFQPGKVTGSIGETGGSQPHSIVQKSEVVAFWKRMPDDYVRKEPVFNVYWTSDEQGTQKVSEINERQAVYLWIDVQNLLQDVETSGVINVNTPEGIDFKDSVEAFFPKTIGNGKLKLAKLDNRLTVKQDTSIAMGISLLNENNRQIVADLLIKNQNQDIGRRATTLQLALQRQQLPDDITAEMIQLPNIIVSAHSDDEEDYQPKFVEFDTNGNRRLSNHNARQIGIYDRSGIDFSSFAASKNPRIDDIWFYIPATQPIKHIGITSSQTELFGYHVERFTGTYNGVYSDNLPAELRQQSKDWIILRASQNTKELIKQTRAENRELNINLNF